MMGGHGGRRRLPEVDAAAVHVSRTIWSKPLMLTKPVAPGAPASVTVKVKPAIFTSPERAEGEILGVTAKETVPEPVVLLPAVTVIQETSLTADQGQTEPVVTVKLSVP